VGWTAGLGAEMKVTDNISIKAEYDYVDLGTRTAPAGTVATTEDTDISVAFSAARFGLNFHF
jgi:outer membrane immunogenic protein